MSSRWIESGKRVQWLLIAWVLATLSLLGTGCRYNDPSVDLLEGELRWMEDQLYEMENNLEQACVDLSRCKQDAHRDVELYKERAEVRSNSESIAPSPEPETEIPGFHTIGDSSPPAEIIMPDGSVIPDQPAYPVAPADPIALPSEIPIETSPVILSEDDTNTVPTLPDDLPVPVTTNEDDEPTRAELPSPVETNVPDRPGLDAPRPGTPPTLEPIPNGESDEEAKEQAIRLFPQPPEQYSIRLQSHVTSEAIPDRSGIDAHITHVVIKAHRTARHNDGSGHDLEILVQPRNADGNYVSLPANLSVVVIDDNVQGAAARIARWDLDASEASRRFRKTEHGEGMHLEFDWPLDPPTSDKLHLYVRYMTVDGRKLQTHQFLEPLTDVENKKDEQWNIVGRAQPANGWRVMATVPIEQNFVAPVPKPNPVIPVSAAEIEGKNIEPAVANVGPISSPSKWETVSMPASNPQEPRRMPNVTAQPIPKSASAPIGSGIIPASVPQWSPRR